MSDTDRLKKLLEPAIRQYRHNNSDEFVMGYDPDETKKIVALYLDKALKEQWETGWDDAVTAIVDFMHTFPTDAETIEEQFLSGGGKHA